MPPAEENLILTEHLLLRPFRLDDFDSLHRLTSRPETFRYPQREPFGMEEAWSRLLRHIGHWAALGYGFFAVEERSSGRFIGEAGLGIFRRDVGAGFDNAPEATWTIEPEAQGKGYATEAAGAALEWGERRFGFERTLCMIHEDNLPSLRVAAKLGYNECGRVTYKDHPSLLFDRQRPQA